jgi:hypothetical protein
VPRQWIPWPGRDAKRAFRFPKGGRAVGDPGTPHREHAACYRLVINGSRRAEIFAGKRPKIQSVLSLHFTAGPILSLFAFAQLLSAL